MDSGEGGDTDLFTRITFVWWNTINMMIGSEILTHMVLEDKKMVL